MVSKDKNLQSFWNNSRVFVIAEAGSNWRMGTEKRDREMAKTLIDVAVEAGADAVKFQTYTADGVYVKNAGSSDYLEESGIKEDIRDIFDDLAMPHEMIPELSEYCQKQGIQFMSTPFSKADFDAVDPYVDIHKIASYEISHPDLIHLAARSSKPTIMSTGASDKDDIKWAVDTFFASGGKDLCLLQCTAKYPAPPDSLNLQVIPWLAEHFDVASGLSDHSREPLFAPVAAVAKGARVIEKHYTLHNRLPGADHPFAITAEELKDMVDAIRVTEKMLGSGKKEVLPDEEELSAFAKRGVQVIKDIAEGDIFEEEENIAVLRPGKQTRGIHPKFLPQIQGKKSKRSIKAGEGLQEGDWAEG